MNYSDVLRVWREILGKYSDVLSVWRDFLQNYNDVLVIWFTFRRLAGIATSSSGGRIYFSCFIAFLAREVPGAREKAVSTKAES